MTKKMTMTKMAAARSPSRSRICPPFPSIASSQAFCMACTCSGVGAVGLGSSARENMATEDRQTAAQAAIKEIGIAIGMSIVAWFVALVLYSYTQTQITIFGFTFDPSQVMPTIVIGLLAAGGPPVVAKIKEAMSKP